jgi:CheY-like chemotaxis protein
MTTKPFAIALLGFSAFERSTFVSFFRLAARRVAGYEAVNDPYACDMVVANADDPATMHRLMVKPPAVPVLLIGASDDGTGWPLHSRPIKLMPVLTAIDEVLAPAIARARATPGELRGTGPAYSDTRPAGEAELTHLSAGPGPAPADDGILVVDDSDTALQFMRRLLLRVGFSCELVRSAQAALAKLDERAWRFVFLDVTMEGMDGYQACKLIKQRKYPAGTKAPVVVMLTSRASAIDKIKGSMAGCDAYMVKPLEERALLKLLAKYDDQVQRGFQATNLR